MGCRSQMEREDRVLEWGEGRRMTLQGGHKINLRKRTVKETLVE